MLLNLGDADSSGAPWQAIRQINTLLIAFLTTAGTFFSIALVMWLATIVAL
jgi:hypothetical protein